MALRFIDIGSQCGLDEEWPREFAIFNTETDNFLDFDGDQVFRSWEQLHASIQRSGYLNTGYAERMKNLLPDWAFKKELVS